MSHLIIAMVVVFVVVMAVKIYFIIQSRKWPQVMGKLWECKVEDWYEEGMPQWQVKVGYTYSVNNQTYDGTRVSYGYSGSSDAGQHLEILKKLKQSTDVVVYYNPSFPQMSVLYRGGDLPRSSSR